MPAVSKSQQGTAALALAIKRGHAPSKPKGTPLKRWRKILRVARRMASSMSEEQLRHYAETPTKGLPKRKRRNA